MDCDEFIARVREHGEYRSTDEARKITEDVLEVLAQRLDAAQAEDLASRMPDPVGRALTGPGRRQREEFGIEEFYRRVADRTGARPRTAQWDAGAVLSAVADAVTGGELDQLVSRLPADYAALFGRAAPAG
ncbi:DUF2267 domain-containing protein [Streptomyces sp. NPDC001348]